MSTVPTNAPRARRPLLGALLTAAALLALAAPAAAGAEPSPTTEPTPAPAPAPTPTTRVAATIAYTDGSKSTVPVWKNIRVTITKDGTELLKDALLPAIARDSVFAAPKLRAVDLDDDREAEVIVDVFTAGVDCCRRSVVYHRTGTRYRSQVLTWADSGYRLANATGGKSPEFLSADARVPEAWGADVRGPLRVYGLRGGTVRDISRQAPKQLARDARIHQRALRSIRRKKRGDARPVIAAYVADLVRLGRVRDARAVIRSAARRHELGMATRSFERTLDRRLVDWGFSTHRSLAG